MSGFTNAGMFPATDYTDSDGNVIFGELTVYSNGARSTVATLYTDQTMAATAANPVSPDVLGNFSFFAAPGVYYGTLNFGSNSVPTIHLVQPWPNDLVQGITGPAGPAGSPGTGALDTVATDIQPIGTVQSAGSSGLYADAKHAHVGITRPGSPTQAVPAALPRFNVMDYGANVILNDNSPAWNACIADAQAAGCAVIQSPPGTFLVQNPVLVPNNDPTLPIIFDCAGDGITTLMGHPQSAGQGSGTTGILCATGVVFCGLGPHFLKNVTIDGGCMAVVGTLTSALTQQQAINSLPITWTTGAPAIAQIGTQTNLLTLTASSSVSISGFNQGPGVLNGMVLDNTGIGNGPANGANANNYTTLTSGGGGAAGSLGSSIPVASLAGEANATNSSGTLYVQTSAGWATYTYTGHSGGNYTGCAFVSGSGTIPATNAVVATFYFPPGTILGSGQGTNTFNMTLGGNPVTCVNPSTAASLLFTNGAGSSCGNVIYGGMVKVVNGTSSQSFALTGLVQGTPATLGISYEYPMTNFPIGSQILAPVAQGAGQGYLDYTPQSSKPRPPKSGLHDVTIKNLNQWVRTPSDQQYAFMFNNTNFAQDLVSLTGDVQVGPNTNPNQDAFTFNVDSHVVFDRIRLKQHFRSGNFFTVKSVRGNIFDIEDPLPGAMASGQASGNVRATCLGESDAPGTIGMTLRMTDRNLAGENVYAGARGLDLDVELPGTELLVGAQVLAGCVCNGTTTVTNPAGFPLVYPGMSVWGTGVSPVTVVQSVSGTTMVVSQPISTGTVTLTFDGISVGVNAAGQTVETVTVTGASGGTFKLTDGTNTSTAIAWNATNTTVQTALAGVAGGAITVSGGTGGPWVLTAPIGEFLTVTANLLTGSSPQVTTALTGSCVLVTCAMTPPSGLLAYLAGVGAPVEINEIEDSTNAWNNFTANQRLTIGGVTSGSGAPAQFTVQGYDAHAITAQPIVNKGAGNPGSGKLTYAVFNCGLCYLDVNNNSQQYAMDSCMIRGKLGSGIIQQNAPQGSGPLLTHIAGLVGARWNGSTAIAPFDIEWSKGGSVQVFGRFDLCGAGSLFKNGQSVNNLDVIALGSATGISGTPTLLDSGTVANSVLCNVENIFIGAGSGGGGGGINPGGTAAVGEIPIITSLGPTTYTLETIFVPGTFTLASLTAGTNTGRIYFCSDNNGTFAYDTGTTIQAVNPVQAMQILGGAPLGSSNTALPNGSIPLTSACTWSINSNTINSSVNPITAGVVAGDYISGNAGIPNGAQVQSVTGTTIVINTLTTTSQSSAVTLTAEVPGVKTHNLNFIAGTGISLAGSGYDAANDKVDIQIAATGGGSGGILACVENSASSVALTTAGTFDSSPVTSSGSFTSPSNGIVFVEGSFEVTLIAPSSGTAVLSVILTQTTGSGLTSTTKNVASLVSGGAELIARLPYSFRVTGLSAGTVAFKLQFVVSATAFGATSKVNGDPITMTVSPAL